YNPHFFPNEILQAMVEYTPRINQFSCSWSWPGGPNSAFDGFLLQAIAQGQSFFIASGDDAANWSVGRGHVDDPVPSTTPLDNAFATIVGGTMLTTTGPGGAWVSESVWNRCNESPHGSSG